MQQSLRYLIRDINRVLLTNIASFSDWIGNELNAKLFFPGSRRRPSNPNPRIHDLATLSRRQRQNRVEVQFDDLRYRFD
ncbi:MAG: hypothetical protein K0S45_1995 [Nitrospira sp.]|nr:hypothetical protein [Nitrospira sp.]